MVRFERLQLLWTVGWLDAIDSAGLAACLKADFECCRSSVKHTNMHAHMLHTALAHYVYIYIYIYTHILKYIGPHIVYTYIPYIYIKCPIPLINKDG